MKIVLGQLGEYECRNDDTLIIDQTWLGYRFPLIQDMLNDFPDQDDIEIPIPYNVKTGDIERLFNLLWKSPINTTKPSVDDDIDFWKQIRKDVEEGSIPIELEHSLYKELFRYGGFVEDRYRCVDFQKLETYLEISSDISVNTSDLVISLRNKALVGIDPLKEIHRLFGEDASQPYQMTLSIGIDVLTRCFMNRDKKSVLKGTCLKLYCLINYDDCHMDDHSFRQHLDQEYERQELALYNDPVLYNIADFLMCEFFTNVFWKIADFTKWDWEEVKDMVTSRRNFFTESVIIPYTARCFGLKGSKVSLFTGCVCCKPFEKVKSDKESLECLLSSRPDLARSLFDDIFQSREQRTQLSLSLRLSARLRKNFLSMTYDQLCKFYL